MKSVESVAVPLARIMEGQVLTRVIIVPAMKKEWIGRTGQEPVLNLLVITRKEINET